MARTARGLFRAVKFKLGDDRFPNPGEGLRAPIEALLGFSASGRRGSDFILDAITNFASSDYSSSTVYNNNDLIHFTFDFQAGALFSYIRRPEEDWSTIIDGGVDPGTKDAVVTDVTYPAAAGQNNDNSIELQLKSATTVYGTVVDETQYNYFRDLNGEPWEGLAGYDPAIPGFDLNQYWQIAVGPSEGPPIPAPAHTFGVEIAYPPDTGEFNPECKHGPFNVTVRDQVIGATLEYRWWYDAAKTQRILDENSDPFTGLFAYWLTGPDHDQSGTVYVEYRQVGGSTWFDYPSNGAGIAWDDPRF